MTDDDDTLDEHDALAEAVEMASQVRRLIADVSELLCFDPALDDELIATLIRSARRTLTSLKEAVDMQHVERLRKQPAETAE